VIAHKNLRKLFVLTLISALVFPTTASAAPKLVTVKSAVKWAESAEVELFAVTAESVITLKNVLTNTSNIEIQARDFAGASL